MDIKNWQLAIAGYAIAYVVVGAFLGYDVAGVVLGAAPTAYFIYALLK